MKKLIVVYAVSLVLLLTQNSILAQRPDWADAAKRKILYPESQYLLGFYSESNITANTPDITARVSQLAKNQLIESIQIPETSSTELNIESKNGKVNESMKNASVQKAKADIVGIKIESFYDSKAKEIYAVAYAKKQEVIVYYQALVSKNSSEIEKKIALAAILAPTSVAQSLKTYLEAIAMGNQTKEAQAILLALGIPSDTEKAEDLSIKAVQTVNTLLSSLEITAKDANRTAKIGQPLKEPLQVKITNKAKNKAEENMPVVFTFLGENIPYNTATTDKEGNAKCFITKITSAKTPQIVQAKIDIAKLLPLQGALVPYISIPEIFSEVATKFFIKVVGMTAYVEAIEMNLGEEMAIKYIEPKLKEYLASQRGFTFSDDMSKADYAIYIKASSRAGSDFNGIYFSFVDANVWVVDLATGNEIYKKAYPNIKGDGTDFQNAGIKAYQSVTESAVREMSDGFLK
jgi:hypothetical protein